jgi:hypothetical protein
VNPAIVGQILFGTMFAFMMARYVLEAPWTRDLDPPRWQRRPPAFSYTA